ncbi:hypothetical protein G9C85_11610 [Halorubellus sp. JP-L1]|uniref:DUF7283 family protein n=1 Tax=Halorubellus sp. JP-L1 TaxID=2715753 RepID=UPI001408B02A|nr:hypothetical protein [Halorubellus sp. JP-L1]NHN42267.1 hypothetical protein [Halorubellus sp. JP-L1]
MFDVPLSATYCFLGLAAASLVVVGVAADLPTRPPPDARAAANSVDALAASDYPGTATHPLEASSVRVTPRSLGLRTDAGATHARFAFGPVTPVDADSRLGAVARGTPPSEAFESPRALAAMAEATREDAGDATWRSARDEIVVRRVNWGDVHVTLVLT